MTVEELERTVEVLSKGLRDTTQALERMQQGNMLFRDMLHSGALAAQVDTAFRSDPTALDGELQFIRSETYSTTNTILRAQAYNRNRAGWDFAWPFTRKGTDIASAATLPLPDTGMYAHVTGTTTLTALSTLTQGALVALCFDSAALTITYNATSMKLAGQKDYVTLAGDPSRYGQTVKMGPLTYTSPIDRKSYTLPDVTGYVHDTGSAFRGRPDKLDVAAGDYRGYSPQAASAAVTVSVCVPFDMLIP